MSRYWLEAEAVLNPASPDCFGSRSVCTYDFVTGYDRIVDENHGFREQWVLGYWDYATINGQNVASWRFWGNTTNDHWVTNCNVLYGDGMQAGGFFVLDTWHPSAGFEGNTQSTDWINSCNDDMP